MNQAVKPIPDGFTSITPHLVCDGATQALAFYRQAFGAVELFRMPGPGGKIMHAEMRIGDAVVMLADEFPEYGSRGPKTLGGTAVTIHLYVPDADAVWDQALAAGAQSVMPLADAFWGDRYGQLSDPFGHVWSIATHQRDLTPEQMQEAMRQEMGG